MLDNDLDEARKRQTFYQSLVMEGKAMADINMHKLQSILPYSTAFSAYTFSPSYTSMLERLTARDTRRQRFGDAVVFVFTLVALVFAGKSLLALFLWHTGNVLGECITILISTLVLFLFGNAYIGRRYAEHARNKIYTDPTFFRKAMDIPGAVRVFWILRESNVPNSYTLKDFPRISGHIQNEDAQFYLRSSDTVRAALRADADVVALFKEASVKGYIFTTVTYNDAARAQYDTFASDSNTFEQDVMDLFTADMHFFDIMHTKYLDSFTITTGTGKEQRTLIFTP
jgi:hypothetical protein